jgi:uncharacterized protein
LNENLPLPQQDLAAPLPSPLNRSERVEAIDVARGVALLGIFFVNAEAFGQPFFSTWMDTRAAREEGVLSVAVYWFTVIFCTGKFYPLFSILFGFGVGVMLQSADRSGRSFHWTFLRRLVVLAIFGIAHIILLWPGDILLMYAATGLCMLLLARRSPRMLLLIAGLVYGAGFLLSVAAVWLMIAMSDVTGADVEVKEMPSGSNALHQFFLVMEDWNETEVYDSRLIELETQIMKNGPFWAAAGVRIFHYMSGGIFVILFSSGIILPCFCLGTALLKLGFFHGQARWCRTLFLRTGLAVGFPLSMLAAVAMQSPENPRLVLAATLAMVVGGPLMSLMYLSLMMTWSESGRARRFINILANAGRMALTCYLMQSLLMSAIMLHWGGARFANNSWAERAVWLLMIYLIILVFANLWLTYFRMGPLEWVWRTLTYLRPIPLCHNRLHLEQGTVR